MSDPLFREMVVWRRSEAGKALRYNCLQRLDSLEWAVHTSDIFGSIDAVGTSDRGLALFLDLFLDVSPLERCQWYESLQLAITAHDALFE